MKPVRDSLMNSFNENNFLSPNPTQNLMDSIFDKVYYEGYNDGKPHNLENGNLQNIGFDSIVRRVKYKKVIMINKSR